MGCALTAWWVMRPVYRHIPFFSGAVLSAFLISGLSASASPASDQLLNKGIAEIEASQDQAAYADFEAAHQADPSDSNTLFFQGMALNRLGRFAEAAAVLHQAAKAGNRNRDLAFEGAWAHLRLGHYQKAIELLNLYEKINPGRGQTSEFLGRAYAGLGQYDKARAELAEALRRDPNLQPTAGLLAAGLDAFETHSAQARSNLIAALHNEKDTPLGRALAPLTVTRPPAKPWSVSFSAGGGYNSNVANNGTGFPMPAGVAYRGASFGEFTVDGSYRWDLSQHDHVKVGYDLQSDIYEGASALDQNDHFWSATYNHDWNNTTAASVRLSDEYTTIAGNSFRNQLGTRLAVGERLASWNTLEASYTYNQATYYFILPPADNRSGNLHTFSLADYALVPHTPLSLGLSYYHTIYDAQGSDFASDNDGLVVSASSPLAWRFTGTVFYNIEFDDYRHPNTFGVAGQSRWDEINTVTVQLTRPVADHVKLYGRFSYLSDDSNLSFFNYDQKIVSGGVIVQF